MKAYLGTIVCKFGGDPVICLQEGMDGEKIMTLAFFVLKPEVSQPLAGWCGHTDTNIHTPDTTYHEPFLHCRTQLKQV